MYWIIIALPFATGQSEKKIANGKESGPAVSNHDHSKTISQHIARARNFKKHYFMPVLNLNKPGARSTINCYVKRMKPYAFELIFKNDTASITTV